MPGAVPVGKADPAERLEVTVILRRANELPPATEGAAVDHAAFTAKYGARQDDIDAVRRFAENNGLTVVQADAARRTVVLSGTVSHFNAAFGVDLKQYKHPGGTYRGREGQVSVPIELKDVVEAVLGLDNRPQANPHFRMRARQPAPPLGNIHKRPASAKVASFTPLELASLYDFPAGTGKGQCIAIIELGGGFRPADLATYFSKLNVKAPNVVAISVDHAGNRPTGNPDGPDGEVMLDIEVAGAIAPEATIAVYFAPNTDAGFLDAVTTAVHDTTNKPSVISISWGGPESSWTPQAMTVMDEAFQSAAALGITVCAATGDNGSTDGVPGNVDHADFPASSPHVLACGGTSLHANGAGISAEVVWNDGAQGGATGGGISAFFGLPKWQNGLVATTAHGAAALRSRGIPDVCGDADPLTGYEVVIDGESTTIGGTSAVAPLWAGLIARINGSTGSRAGFMQPALYASPAALNDITSGNNGGYFAGKGWDACTGLGSPRGKPIQDLFRKKPQLVAVTTGH